MLNKQMGLTPISPQSHNLLEIRDYRHINVVLRTDDNKEQVKRAESAKQVN